MWYQQAFWLFQGEGLHMVLISLTPPLTFHFHKRKNKSFGLRATARNYMQRVASWPPQVPQKHRMLFSTLHTLHLVQVSSRLLSHADHWKSFNEGPESCILTLQILSARISCVRTSWPLFGWNPLAWFRFHSIYFYNYLLPVVGTLFLFQVMI